MNPVQLFQPILAGATLKERVLACLGALFGIALTGWICTLLLAQDTSLPLIIAPIGASAVLLFAVPVSPLAQPWPIIGGNVISALVGISVAILIDTPFIAAGVGVALAIAAMSFARCLHPPGGAVSLMTVLGANWGAEGGYLYAFFPVGLNSVILVALGIAVHKLSGRQYPHRPAVAVVNPHLTKDPPPELRLGFNADDVSAALEAIDETFDIHPGDLTRLLYQVERQALARQHGEILASHIMSCDVIKIRVDSSVDQARNLLLTHNIRALPVVDGDDKLLGIVGLRELTANGSDKIENYFIPAPTASPEQPAMSLVPLLSDGIAHAVIVTDEKVNIVGLISQTDLLNALARSLRYQKPARNRIGFPLLRRAS